MPKWKTEGVQIKLEGTGNRYINDKQGVVNTLLGTGKGLELFNAGIEKAEVLGTKPYGSKKTKFTDADLNHF
ncbi:hypothetical protein [Undibacterium sp. TC9W]|uniref:hypothetical protein n=1 Tax=Undibacterium sp. TC9W TaxID=3413053 RepID=UPI003BF2295F